MIFTVINGYLLLSEINEKDNLESGYSDLSVQISSVDLTQGYRIDVYISESDVICEDVAPEYIASSRFEYRLKMEDFENGKLYRIVLKQKISFDETKEIASGYFSFEKDIPSFQTRISRQEFYKVWKTLVYLEKKLAENEAALKTLTEGYVTE